MEPTYFWTGSKPLRRCIPGAWNASDEVVFGETFTPSPAELLAFQDKSGRSSWGHRYRQHHKRTLP